MHTHAHGTWGAELETGFFGFVVYLLFVSIFFQIVNMQNQTAFSGQVTRSISQVVDATRFGPYMIHGLDDVSTTNDIFFWLQAFLVNVYDANQVEEPRARACILLLCGAE